MKNFETVPPVIDYKAHPAFSKLRSQIEYSNNAAISKRASSVDVDYESLKANLPKTDRELKSVFNETVGAKIEDLKKEVFSQILDKDQRLTDWLNRAFAKTLHELGIEIEYLFKSREMLEKGRVQSSKKTATFQDNGFVANEFNLNLKNDLTESCSGYISQLKKMAKDKPNVRVAISIPMYGKFGRTIRRILESTDILGIASDYKGHPMDLMYASIDYSYGGQNWFQDCYSDLGIPTQKTATMHYDYENTMLKGMIYLTPVDTVAKGAFHIVPGSNQWRRSSFLFNFYKDLDIQYSEVFGQDLGTYYRPRFKTALGRQTFLNLPSSFQGSSHFGDDLMDSSELSDFLLKKETPLLSDSPLCLLFDGPKAIHRGALAYSGERVAIQLGFKLKEEISPVVGALRKARGMAGRIRRLQSPF